MSMVVERGGDEEGSGSRPFYRRGLESTAGLNHSLASPQVHNPEWSRLNSHS